MASYVTLSGDKFPRVRQELLATIKEKFVPVGVLDTAGYYGRMIEFLNDSVQAGFMSAGQMELIRIADTAEPLLAQLVSEAQAQRRPTDLSRI